MKKEMIFFPRKLLFHDLNYFVYFTQKNHAKSSIESSFFTQLTIVIFQKKFPTKSHFSRKCAQIFFPSAAH